VPPASPKRLQTKRGTGENVSTVDWIAPDLCPGFFDGAENSPPPTAGSSSTGPRTASENFVNYDYAWNIFVRTRAHRVH